ncbi:hypothetical protein E4U56_006825 [Claviceps arundinis]|uniref:Uncharacterized protein n=1 Tax=Claviceps arundinis TaxID=1623583 RepID=A0A9P7MW16_9HYPO|nr:hypothetical protein E4U56_006825 [Claviceps arundinis]
MLSNSFSAARTAVRDLFRSTDGRRNRDYCWTEPPDEWGVSTAAVASSTGDYSKKWAAKDVGCATASDETFFTSKSWQSNLSGMCEDYGDGPAVSMDNVVIQEGPRRNVRHVRSSPAVEERYLVLERVPAFLEKDDEPVEVSHDAAQMGCSPPGTVTAGAGERDNDYRDEQTERADDGLGCRRITASTLFAYRAMNAREQDEHTTRLPQEAAYSEDEPPEKDTLLQDCVPPIVGTATEDYLSTTGVAYRHDGVYTSPMGIQPMITDISSDFAHKYDISDSEGSSSGCISPRTFRAWATGCSQRRGKSEREDVYLSACRSSDGSAASELRIRPGTGDGASGWSSSEESQPCWKRNRVLEWHDRIPDPRPKHPSLWPLPPGQVINLTNPTVLSALSHPSAPSHLADVPLAYIPSALQHRYQLLHSSRHAEAHLARLRDDAQARIHYLLTMRNMAETSPSTIDDEEKERSKQRENPEEKQRREEIYRHVEGHLEDVVGLCEDSQGRVRALADEVEWLMGRERMLSEQ